MLYLIEKENGIQYFFELPEGVESAYLKVDPRESHARLFKKGHGKYIVTKIDEMGQQHIYRLTEVYEISNSTKKYSSLNMSNLQMTKEWEKENTAFTIPDISAAVAEIAVNLSEGYLPHFFDFVLVTLTDDLIRHPKTYEVWRVQMINGTLEEIVDLTHGLLMTNKSFREWNLTALEMQNHIDVDDDETRQKSGLFEKSDKKFIDLDAFKQNLYCSLRRRMIENYFFNGNPHS